MTINCPYCGQPAKFVSGEVIYPHRGDLAAKQFWHCEPCDVSVANVPGFPGYRATSDGTVWSCWNSRWGKSKTWRKLRSNSPKKGYPTIHMSKAKKAFTHTVHSVVLRSFVGPRPANKEGCHGDRNTLNNRLENLRWDTSAGNSADTVRHGTIARGVKQKAAKLTDAKVRTIRRLAKQGANRRGLSKRFGICLRSIYKIINRTIWKHVT